MILLRLLHITTIKQNKVKIIGDSRHPENVFQNNYKVYDLYHKLYTL